MTSEARLYGWTNDLAADDAARAARRGNLEVADAHT
jgi:hypothetical protein